jgi:hypothetical protein
MHSGVIDIAGHWPTNFVDFLREFEAIFKKALKGPRGRKHIFPSMIDASRDLVDEEHETRVKFRINDAYHAL